MGLIATGPISGRDQLNVFSDRGLYIGDLGDRKHNSIHAIKIIVALDGHFRIRYEDGPWQTVTSAVVAPNQRHAVHAEKIPAAIGYVLPHGSDSDGFIHTVAGTSQTNMPEVEALRAPLRRELGCPHTADVAAAWLSQLFERVKNESDVRPLDPRIMRIVELVQHAGAAPLAEAARSIGLSPSRFSHLFREETGVTYRHYSLVMRVKNAVGRLGGCDSLTAAAFNAGFADLAHFSRSFRRMFGHNPSDLVRVGSIRTG